MDDSTIYSVTVESTADETIIKEWKAIYDEYIQYLKPNQKSASEIVDYIKNKYPTEDETSEKVRKVVMMNAREHQDYLPDGIFINGGTLEVIALRIKNGGTGKVLYERQQQDYKDLMEEHRKINKDIEDLSMEEFPIPIFIGVEKRSGYVYIEGSPTLSDDVTIIRGLNEKELTNIYLVAHYIQILKKHNNLDFILDER